MIVIGQNNVELAAFIVYLLQILNASKCKLDIYLRPFVISFPKPLKTISRRKVKSKRFKRLFIGASTPKRKAAGVFYIGGKLFIAVRISERL